MLMKMAVFVVGGLIYRRTSWSRFRVLLLVFGASWHPRWWPVLRALGAIGRECRPSRGARRAPSSHWERWHLGRLRCALELRGQVELGLWRWVSRGLATMLATGDTLHTWEGPSSVCIVTSWLTRVAVMELLKHALGLPGPWHGRRGLRCPAAVPIQPPACSATLLVLHNGASTPDRLANCFSSYWHTCCFLPVSTPANTTTDHLTILHCFLHQIVVYFFAELSWRHIKVYNYPFMQA